MGGVDMEKRSRRRGHCVMRSRTGARNSTEAVFAAAAGAQGISTVNLQYYNYVTAGSSGDP